MRQIKNSKLKVGIVGLGAIGSFLVSNLAGERFIEVIAGADTSPEKREEMKAAFPDLFITDDYKSFPDNIDVLVECAGAPVADPLALWGLKKGLAVVVASVGGLSDIRPLRRLARETGGHLYIPSGAIAGLDALKAIPSESIKEISITTTKNPANFKGNPYIDEHGIDLDGLTGPTVIFDGNAGDAVKAFPKNINVSAVLSYAGIGRKNTRVIIKAEPGAKINRHQIYVKSDHGEIKVEVNNLPFENNPRTSKLAAFSILAAVRSLVYTITIG